MAGRFTEYCVIAGKIYTAIVAVELEVPDSGHANPCPRKVNTRGTQPTPAEDGSIRQVQMAAKCPVWHETIKSLNPAAQTCRHPRRGKPKCRCVC